MQTTSLAQSVLLHIHALRAAIVTCECIQRLANGNRVQYQAYYIESLHRELTGCFTANHVNLHILTTKIHNILITIFHI